MAIETNRTSLGDKRIMVTGGAGFLGRVVVRKLRERGAQGITIPRRAICDLTREKVAERLLDQCQPHLLLHLAATVDNPACAENTAASFCSNVLMTTRLMDAAARHGIEKMVCLGSASSYPVDAAVPLKEEDLFAGFPEASREAHGIAKRLPLIQARACRKQYALRCVFLIPTNLYGPGDNFDLPASYVIPSLIRKLVEATEARTPEVILRGTGSAWRDFLHVEDCAEAILLALDRYQGEEAVNLGSGTEISIHDLAQQIARLVGYSGKILWDANYPDGMLHRLLDTSRAEREFGFRACKSLQDGMRETIEWYRSARVASVSREEARAVSSRG